MGVAPMPREARASPTLPTGRKRRRTEKHWRTDPKGSVPGSVGSGVFPHVSGRQTGGSVPDPSASRGGARRPSRSPSIHHTPQWNSLGRRGLPGLRAVIARQPVMDA
ncbi:hypothetical protein NS365_22795 [Aureimonas ureilytica]|uniref:Uncharacterized protein n=1 Tax=Aureimonas ureilytica TaxID=401562 RepID=A0A175RET2_9HYPH|nr:hypothetical protein NS365_22795 [Aureimonas ureilytica]